MSLALALKYRPKLFSDLVGQDSVSTTLSLALETNRIVHAYLFSGLRGSGKTSSARILARALVCDNGPTPNPCGICPNCVAALNGTHIDIVEMDAASNRRIDDIRSLIEHTRYAPTLGKYKVFIIDEVHMLTDQAANALLKTLEEPPNFVKFILATTDPLKLPPTILSRTQHYRFKKIPQKSVIAHLENILEKENVAYEKGSLEIIARSGSGSMRDTLTLTDQAINYCNRYLEINKLVQMLGVIDPNTLKEFFNSILHKDENALKIQLEILSEYECEMIIDEMIEFLKNELFNKSTSFPLLLIDRFLGILAESKKLLTLNPSGDFVLLLMSLKMKEALNLRDIEIAIKELESSSEVKAALKKAESSLLETKIESSETKQEPQATQVLDSSLESKKSSDELNTQKQLNTQERDEDLAPWESIDESLESNSPPKVEQHNLEDSSLNKELFKELVSLIYDRSMPLGYAFERSVTFQELKDDTLIWSSNPNEEDRKMLGNFYKTIQELANQVFKRNLKIINSNKVEQKESKQIESKQIESNEPVKEEQDNQNNAQDFLEQNKDLIKNLKENFGVTEVKVETIKL